MRVEILFPAMKKCIVTQTRIERWYIVLLKLLEHLNSPVNSENNFQFVVYYENVYSPSVCPTYSTALASYLMEQYHFQKPPHHQSHQNPREISSYYNVHRTPTIKPRAFNILFFTVQITNSPKNTPPCASWSIVSFLSLVKLSIVGPGASIPPSPLLLDDTSKHISYVSVPLRATLKRRDNHPRSGNITDEFNARLLATGCGWRIVRVATCRMTAPTRKRLIVQLAQGHGGKERKTTEGEKRGGKKKGRERRVTLVGAVIGFGTRWGGLQGRVVLHGPAALHGRLDAGYDRRFTTVKCRGNDTVCSRRLPALIAVTLPLIGFATLEDRSWGCVQDSLLCLSSCHARSRIFCSKIVVFE